MNAVLVFLVGLAATMGVVLVALLYLRNPLQIILTDLCGTTDRARFWTVFSNITLFLVPLALALDHQPDANSKQAAIFEISGQIESATIGFVSLRRCDGIHPQHIHFPSEFESRCERK